MSGSLTGIPGGDPLSAAFPAQLDATVAALERRLVNTWPSLADRAAAYAAAGMTPQVGEVFTLGSDPGAVYTVAGADVGSFSRIVPGMQYVTGQVKVIWPTDGGIRSQVSRVAWPAGVVWAERPIILLTPINGPSADPAVIGTLCKDNADTPMSEVTLTDFGIQMVCINHDTGFSSGSWRYCHFAAWGRTVTDGLTATLDTTLVR